MRRCRVWAWAGPDTKEPSSYITGGALHTDARFLGATSGVDVATHRRPTMENAPIRLRYLRPSWPQVTEATTSEV
jgi:hypothetical protein